MDIYVLSYHQIKRLQFSFTLKKNYCLTGEKVRNRVKYLKYSIATDIFGIDIF